jgi:peptidoglycan hydrolase-like protein with peptidoglycan-binding domain
LLYLGTNLGVYRSIDRGTNWAPVWSPTNPNEKKKATAKRGAKKPAATTRGRRPAAANNETILQAQQALRTNGYHLGEPDGRAGKATIAAVKKFQTDRHLPVTGKLDAITLGALGVGGPSTGGGQVDVTKANVILADAVNALVHTVDPETQQPGYLAATNTGLYRSLDPSKGWQKLSYGSFDPRTTCISTNLKTSETIWVGTPSSGVLVSNDSGNTWRQVQGIPTDMPVNTVVQDPQRPANVYVGTKQTVFISQDGGKTWKRRGGNLPFGDFTSILVNPRNSDEIFVGNAYQISEVGGGVYRSIDGGDTWTRIDPKGARLPSQRIWALAFDPHDQDVLFVGSHSAGVYVVPRTSAVLSSAQED